ncbi:MAG TPA: hypothetical protein VJ898_06570, partial [Natrialbaceae archaeon]|nr:hypothetical protein [Natrialbaceae archaeon]
YTNLTVMQSPGAKEIDLQAATIEFIGPDGTDTLTYAGGDGYANNASFGVSAIKDSDSSTPVLNSKEDRMTIHINLTANDGVLQPLDEGSEATLRIVTQSGSQYTYIANVPESLSSKEPGEAVEL